MARTFDSPARFRQSLEERLRQTAEARRIAVNTLRLKLLIERLLARLFAEPDPPWLVKGGFAMELRFRPRGRTTRDLDLAFFGATHEPNAQARLLALHEVLQSAAARDLGDFLVYRIGEPSRLVEAAPEGGARFPVEVSLAGKEYGRFHVDVGIGPRGDQAAERLVGEDLLAFAGLPPTVVLAVPAEVQFAEKIHAYTRPWTDRVNTRTRDLVDLALLIEGGKLDPASLRRALKTTFATRPWSVPAELAPPPASWTGEFVRLAEQAGISARDLDAGFEQVAAYWRLNRLGEAEGC